jgi:putative ABC transport system permease protein
MRIVAPLAAAELVRAPGRTLMRALVLAAAVGLLGAMLLFIGHSLGTMTAGAVRSVPLDWQGPVGSSRSATRVATAVARQPGVAEAVPTATAPFAGLEHISPSAGTIGSGSGSILAVPPDYLVHLKTFRFLRGGLRPGQVVLDQQLAATLQAQPGDRVLLTPRRGSRPVRLRVSGIALVTAPDVLFQPLNPLLGPAQAQPPADIAILPLTTFTAKVAPALHSISSALGASAVPGSQIGTQWQVQAQVDPAALAGSPAHAPALATQLRNRVERSLPGQVVFVDNLADNLNTTAGDAFYAETLYIMLAVPGALVALGLAYLAALGTVERDRQSLALLRARGARRRDLVMLAALESVVLGLLAGAIGTGLALGGVRLAGVSGGIGSVRVLTTLGVCVGLAVAGAAAARIGAGNAAFRGTVGEARRSVRRSRKPLWERLYLDLLCLCVAGLVYWLTARTGFSAVVNPDSNPTLSLSVYMFLAPALLWMARP